MLDDFSGLEIRRTINGMREEDGLPTPPQHPEPLELDENGLPVHLDDLLGRAPVDDLEE